ncbi:ribosomal protein S29 [Theileria orientalis strain Shintoku]|uniref:Ribosomal protein S29 n=1 Tax=Theileria orientalis strain Shintoku TaxID=869250 RepID=J4DP18_THEOR|nr:ribosomal protein S29 [Theileria orientalis strain Shintoku]PVC53074.1 ribosomal protein S29 [Theileria orientalis]BAM39934.1 ribosomal protein S29 [Theileria orientalis strain Shintoku]|eukprot:XP_009690235.1 ribosomal protein S29 [Theileria orientalis strain Shintoku]
MVLLDSYLIVGEVQVENVKSQSDQGNRGDKAVKLLKCVMKFHWILLLCLFCAEARECSFKKELMLLAHNDYRRIHTVQELEWNNELATSAQKEAARITKERCDLPLYYSGLAGTNYLSVGKQQFDEGIAVKFWYEAGVTTRNPNVLAFTQLVWKDTKAIGCGVSCCSENMVLVCRYYPLGNIPVLTWVTFSTNIQKHTAKEATNGSTDSKYAASASEKEPPQLDSTSIGNPQTNLNSNNVITHTLYTFNIRVLICEANMVSFMGNCHDRFHSTHVGARA